MCVFHRPVDWFPNFGPKGNLIINTSLILHLLFQSYHKKKNIYGQLDLSSMDLLTGHSRSSIGVPNSISVLGTILCNVRTPRQKCCHIFSKAWVGANGDHKWQF